MALGVCPLRKSTVQLLPLRYGLVDNPALDPAAEIAMPYSLKSRPLGIRLLRDGWLYVIDGGNGELSEYWVYNGVVESMLFQGKEVIEDEREDPINAPTLIFPKTSTLYVSYAEVQWSANKCRQVINDPAERNYFMQAVDLSRADCLKGAQHLLTEPMVERWLAEYATERVEHEQDHLEADASLAEHAAFSERRRLYAELPEHERLPYLWENPPRFSPYYFAHLKDAIHPQYHFDTLYLVLDDTLGVLRDLANYQDQVAGWVSDWANGGAQAGNNERDYLLACYIESLSQLSDRDVSVLAGATDDPAIKAMFAELENMPEPDRGVTKAAMLEYVNKGGLMTPPAGSPVPADLQVLRERAEAQAMAAAHSGGDGMITGQLITDEVDRRYYTPLHFHLTPSAFVQKHLKALIDLGKLHGERIYDILHGAKFGQRGVNDLIDREAMDRDLLAHRTGLARWNDLLERITADRVALTTTCGFHKNAWYLDPQLSRQVGFAFTLEYACLKDICRSDEACDQLHSFIERQPQFSRPLYYTLPFSEQTGLWVQYAFLNAAGMTVFNNTRGLFEQLRSIEHGRLPALDELPDSTRTVANAAQISLAPALNRGLEKLLAEFAAVFKGQTMPDLDQLFRNLPFALKSNILQAAKTEGVTFKFATPEEKASLRSTLEEVLKQRGEMSKLKRERRQANRTARRKGEKGHTSAQSVETQQKIAYLRWQLDSGEKRLAASISPIVELPDEHARLLGATPERAGLTVIFPNEGQRQAAGLMRDFRNGVKSAPVMNALGDGAALLLFVAQAVNLAQVYKEIESLPAHEQEWSSFTSALIATGAAGFAAAQGVFDTALNAQAKALGESLRLNALSRLEVTIGRLHVSLGVGAYLFGFIAALVSLHTYHKSWVQAVRSGNQGAQHGAMLTMIASGGLALSNAYGGGNLAVAAYELLMATKGFARESALKLWGARLSSVFVRVSWVGGLFTLLELAGVWVYNRYNTSAHDQWLQSVPWSHDLEKRRNATLKEFHNTLTALLQAPFVEIKDSVDEPYLQSPLPNTKVGEIVLVFPGLDISTFQVPLVGIKRRALMIGAQRITTVTLSYKNPLVEHVENVTALLHTGLLRVVSEQEKKNEGSPLLLKLVYPVNAEHVQGKVSEALLIEINLQSWDENERVSEQTYRIRFNALEKGRFPSADHQTFTPEIPLVEVKVLDLAVLK
ncbi:toxin VasX [Pseudomonas sp. 7P_10.2_Bac1]|uniref:toxin VasX n=1 Tax=Pseudomonas sp. 7P_10.2_Bac1 TaxID=2971614 RepID=UPI002905673B|nr:toxin VasX [Pseudomonas sp. 7P_10.2_Bac1]